MKENKKEIIEDLGDGLILRRSNILDVETLRDFNGRMHVNSGGEFSESIAAWIKDLASGNHPTFKPKDFTIVEDTRTGKIVSSLNLIHQKWSFEGIEFGVGRIEAVATEADYRRRGLVRKQMDLAHQWSEDRGDKIQAITGIPWNYRQFGYEMTVNLGGGRRGFLPDIPILKKDQDEPYVVRQPTKKEIPLIKDLSEYTAKRHTLSCKRDVEMWSYEIFGRNKNSAVRFNTRVIEDSDGKFVGYILHNFKLSGMSLNIFEYEIIDGLSWLDVTPSVLRYLEKTGKDYAKKESTKKLKKEMKSFNLQLGEDHPVYFILQNKAPQINTPYAWYLRLPDIVGFLNHISPVLEERLAKSYVVGHSGELKLNFFKSGVILHFDKGKIKAEAWDKPDFEDAHVNFPDLSFLKILFGHRDYEELNTAYADLYCDSNHMHARPLLEALFIRKPSNFMAIE